MRVSKNLKGKIGEGDIHAVFDKLEHIHENLEVHMCVRALFLSFDLVILDTTHPRNEG